MNQTKQMEVLVKVGKKVKSHLVKVELIVLTIFIISMIMKFNSDSTIMGIPLMIGSLCLAFLYFILAFSNAGDNKIERVFSFMSYWALSIAVIGCMFVLEALPGGFIQVQVGGFLLMFVFIIGLFFRGKFKLENFLTKQMIVRVFLVVVATAFFNFAPADTLRTVKIVPYEDYYSSEQSNDSLPETEQIVDQAENLE